MKCRMQWMRLWLVLFCVCTQPIVFAQQSGKTPPVIRSIRPVGTNLLVTVSVPEGARRITLESRPRMGRGGWIPRKDHWPDPTQREVVLSLPMTADMEVLRASSESEEELPLPASFYAGRTPFGPALSTNSTPPVLPGIVISDGSFTDNRNTVTSDRAVVESDIWQIDGSTLYFFNSVRGLQVIDLTEPDLPRLRTTLALSAQGEQMYLLPANSSSGRWLALLTSSNCDGQSGEVILVHVDASGAVLGSRLPYTGQIRESRLVGNALYLATYRWGNTTDAQGVTTWRAETGIHSFDLTDPTHPTPRSETVLPATPDAIHATDQFLLVATSGPASGSDDPSQPVWLRPGSHGVTLFDISDASGTVVQKGTAKITGRVQDKFKLRQVDNVLTVISQQDAEWKLVTRTNRVLRTVGPNGEKLDPPVWEDSLYSVLEASTPSRTWLETFDISTPSKPAALGSLKIVENESLFATRFVGDRAYVVTFRRIDPLWIIDLSNPAKPAIRGELQIPGYSSYLEPVGTNRLLAVGIEGGNASVALFDVTDESKPRQLSKILLGTGWSWSEANSDEKAFRYLPQAGLLLIPWQGALDNSWVNALQLVDYSDDRLIRRGIVPHSIPARRATLLTDRIVSLSAQELLVVDASNRDKPAIRADLDLSFAVQRVRPDGDRLDLLSVASGRPPRLVRASANAPETELGSITLPDLPVVGFERVGSSLHVLQFEPDTYRNEPVIPTNGAPSTGWVQVVVPGHFVGFEITFDGDSPKIAGKTRIQRPDGYYGGDMKGLPAAPGTLIWTETTTPWPWLDFVRPGIAGDLMLPGMGRFAWGWRDRLTLVAEDISQTGRPVLASTVVLGGGANTSGFSDVFAAAGRLFVSHQEIITREEKTPVDGPNGPIPCWVTESRSELDVVDFTDPAEPLIRPPVALPGELAGIARDGALLFTTETGTNTPPDRITLRALTYDGIGVGTVDTTDVGNGSPVVVVPDGRVLTVESASRTDERGTLREWSLGKDARWNRTAGIALPESNATLHRVGSLIIAEGASRVAFLRPGADGTASLGDAPRECGVWFDWAKADSARDATLWLPRGDAGVTAIRPQVSPKGP